jgi:hypothetical protein
MVRLPFSSSSITNLTCNPAVYYRVYTEDEAVPCTQPFDPSNPYLGRIDANLVPPPHTVASIKRSLSRVEKIADHTRTRLFTLTSTTRPLDNEEHLAILAGTGPGSTPRQPLALVQVDSAAGERSASSERSERSASAERPGRSADAPRQIVQAVETPRRKPVVKTKFSWSEWGYLLRCLRVTQPTLCEISRSYG